jgi:hypothetical protein
MSSKTKQKTVTIISYHIFGTKGSYCAALTYRGKTIKCFQGNNEKENVEAARKYAVDNCAATHMVIRTN